MIRLPYPLIWRYTLVATIAYLGRYREFVSLPFCLTFGKQYMSSSYHLWFSRKCFYNCCYCFLSFITMSTTVNVENLIQNILIQILELMMKSFFFGLTRQQLSSFIDFIKATKDFSRHNAHRWATNKPRLAWSRFCKLHFFSFCVTISCKHIRNYVQCVTILLWYFNYFYHKLFLRI